LQDVPGLLIPPTVAASRQQLLTVAEGLAEISERFDGCDFPVILRPAGSHGGRDLDMLASPDDVAAYLRKVGGDEFFISRYIDYRGSDGLFRKCRVAIVDGTPFACHMAISSNWMIHYVNAGMYEDAAKRAEESSFMAHFDEFAERHRSALEAIHERTGLDYVCVDCAETAHGDLLVFEIDHAMIVHAMDLEHLFPYKQIHMRSVRDAFRQFLYSRDARHASNGHAGA
jgi:glutathione synthase/RimK-type ligase-like ATP-grasp enzyme